MKLQDSPLRLCPLVRLSPKNTFLLSYIHSIAVIIPGRAVFSKMEIVFLPFIAIKVAVRDIR